MIHAIADVKIKITAMKQKSMDIEKAIADGKHGASQGQPRTGAVGGGRGQ